MDNKIERISFRLKDLMLVIGDKDTLFSLIYNGKEIDEADDVVNYMDYYVADIKLYSNLESGVPFMEITVSETVEVLYIPTSIDGLSKISDQVGNISLQRIHRGQTGEVFISLLNVYTNTDSCLYFNSIQQFLNIEVNETDNVLLRAYVNDVRYDVKSVKELKEVLSK